MKKKTILATLQKKKKHILKPNACAKNSRVESEYEVGPRSAGARAVFTMSIDKYFQNERTYGIKVSVAPGSVARWGKGMGQTCWMSANVFVAG